uniref:Uncharacterized protein n=1 Tax=Loxodonta africana TaxID=9785 RepID=G3TYK4_LOXAF
RSRVCLPAQRSSLPHGPTPGPGTWFPVAPSRAGTKPKPAGHRPDSSKIFPPLFIDEEKLGGGEGFRPPAQTGGAWTPRAELLQLWEVGLRPARAAGLSKSERLCQGEMVIQEGPQARVLVRHCLVFPSPRAPS